MKHIDFGWLDAFGLLTVLLGGFVAFLLLNGSIPAGFVGISVFYSFCWIVGGVMILIEPNIVEEAESLATLPKEKVTNDH